MYSPSLAFFSGDQFRGSGTSISSQSHNCYELVYFHKASGVLTLGNSTFPLHSGTIYIAYPGTMHSEIHTGNGLVSFLGFNCADFPRNDIPESAFNILQHEIINDIIKNIISEAIEQKHNYTDIISHKLAEIILLLQRYIVNDDTHKTELSYIYSYISEYCNQTIDFNRLAKMSGYSLDHFRHMFTHEFGISPKQLQINARLNNAVDLLLNSNKNCTEIASLCGFSTSSQFSKMFFERYKISPLKFRIKKPAM